jgi:hypothetical protein
MDYEGTLWRTKPYKTAIVICVNNSNGWLTMMQITPPDPTAQKIYIHTSAISRYYEKYV